MTARLPQLGIEEVAPEVRPIYEEHESHSNFVSPLLRILARRPEYALLFETGRHALLSAGSLPMAERVLVMAKTASLNHSPFGVQLARNLGANEAALTAAVLDAALRPHQGNPLLSARQHLLLDFTERIALGVVDDQCWNELTPTFTLDELLQIVVIASAFTFYSDFSRAAGLTSLDLPDRAAIAAPAPGRPA